MLLQIFFLQGYPGASNGAPPPNGYGAQQPPMPANGAGSIFFEMENDIVFCPYLAIEIVVMLIRAFSCIVQG